MYKISDNVLLQVERREKIRKTILYLHYFE